MKTSTKEAILAALKGARDIADAAETGGRDLTADERVKVTEFIKTARDLHAAAADQDSLRQQLSDLSDGLGMLPPGDDKPRGGYAPLERVKGKSLGQSFVDSDAYKALISQHPGGVSEKARIQSQPVGVKGLLTGANHTTGAGTLLTPQNLGMLDPFYQRPLSVRQLFTQGTTSTDIIEYAILNTVTNAAAPVAEATSSGTVGDGTGGTVTAAAGGVKPQSDMTWTKATTTVKTIAHWMAATKRALSDVGQLRTLIDSFLEYGLEEEFEDQLVTGSGTGENFLGINNVSGIQTQTPGVGETAFSVLRKARTKVRLVGRTTPTAYVMHPNDWQAIELTLDAQDRFYGNGPFNLTQPRLWGLPVVESEAIAAGTAWVANWNMGVIWDREQSNIQVTDSHSDFFIRNLVAVLAEMRAAFGVLRPSAFVKVTLP